MPTLLSNEASGLDDPGGPFLFGASAVSLKAGFPPREPVSVRASPGASGVPHLWPR